MVGDGQYYIGRIDFDKRATIRDMQSLKTTLEQELWVDVEVDLSNGYLHLERGERD